MENIDSENRAIPKMSNDSFEMKLYEIHEPKSKKQKTKIIFSNRFSMKTVWIDGASVFKADAIVDRAAAKMPAIKRPATPLPNLNHIIWYNRNEIRIVFLL